MAKGHGGYRAGAGRKSSSGKKFVRAVRIKWSANESNFFKFLEEKKKIPAAQIIREAVQFILSNKEFMLKNYSTPQKNEKISFEELIEQFNKNFDTTNRFKINIALNDYNKLTSLISLVVSDKYAKDTLLFSTTLRFYYIAAYDIAVLKQNHDLQCDLQDKEIIVEFFKKNPPELHYADFGENEDDDVDQIDDEE